MHRIRPVLKENENGVFSLLRAVSLWMRAERPLVARMALKVLRSVDIGREAVINGLKTEIRNERFHMTRRTDLESAAQHLQMANR